MRSIHPLEVIFLKVPQKFLVNTNQRGSKSRYGVSATKCFKVLYYLKKKKLKKIWSLVLMFCCVTSSDFIISISTRVAAVNQVLW